MKSIKLLMIFLTVFTVTCETVKYVEIYPELPEKPIIVDPGRPSLNGDEMDELEVIINQTNLIVDLKLWISTVLKRMGKKGY